VLRETTSRSRCELVCPSRTQYLLQSWSRVYYCSTRVCAVYFEGVCVSRCVLCVYYCSTYYKAVRGGPVVYFGHGPESVVNEFALMRASKAVVMMMLCLNVQTARLNALAMRMVVCDISTRAVTPRARIDVAHRLTCICVRRLCGLRSAGAAGRERRRVKKEAQRYRHRACR
jgi:hypothetical protein